MLGLGLGKVRVSVRWGGRICVTGLCLIVGHFATSAALMGVCALPSAVLVHILHHRIVYVMAKV